MDRRNFLKAIALAGAAFSVKNSGAMTIMGQTFSTSNAAATVAAAGNYDLVAIMGGEPEAMFRAAMKEMGGLAKFVKKGQKVVVKPNIGWDKTPELAGNTNPKLVGEIVKQCFDCGASQVQVFDHTCDDWRKCYANSGIEAAVKKAGGTMIPAHEESYYREISLPKGLKLKSAKVHQALLDSDVWLNVPVLKNHGGAQMSIAMKNHMGIVWDRRYFHSNDLQQCIADMCTLDKAAVLQIVDAYRLMKTNGPRGKDESDVVLSKAMFVSQDIVAVDTAATNFFNQVREMPLDNVEHLANGEKLQLGTMKLDSLKVKRVKL